ncbi:MAG: hypothetical protein IKC49_00585, partial [Clostridia bacterium]|nr:hypothetical protein [Clostridia bacterium]
MPKRRIVLSSIMVLATALVAVFSLGIFQSVMNLSDKSNAADSYVTSPYTSFYNGNGVDISSFDVSGQASYYYDERWDIGWINSGQYGVIYAVNDGEQIGPGLKNIYSYYKKNYPSAIYDFDSYYNESDFANYYKRTYYNGYHTSYSSTGVGANVGYGAEAYGYLYAIDSIQGFNNFATLVAKGFTFAGKIVVLECDLDFGGQTINPVGNNGADLGSFCGIFDGNYHTLSNFTINRSGAAYVGLFSSLSGGMITRLRVKNATIGGSGYAYELYAGGLVGVAGSTGTIYDYGFSSADSYGTFAKVGMVGYGESTIDQCIVENVTLKNSNTSGLNYYGAGGFVGLGVGDSSLLVLDCISRGITYSGFADSSAVFGPAAVKNTNSGPTYTIKRNEGYADNAIFRVNIHTSAIDKVVTQWTRNWYASIADFSEDETIRPYTNTDMAELDEVYSDNLAYGMQWSSIKGEDSSNPWYFVEPHGGLGLRGFMGWKKIRVRVGDYESYDCDDTWSYPYVTNPVPSTDSLWEIETEYPYMPYTWVSSDAEITLGEITSGDELTVSNYVFRAYGNSLYVFDEWNMSAIKGNGVITYTIGASFKKIGDCVVEFSKSDTMVGYNWYSYCGYYYTVSLGSGWSWLDGSYSSTFAMAYDTQITFYEN